ncbi:MAG: hypothetical protein EP332_11215 [Bacteroidetes bacterium]|nr:MAG: hypothetical protein EP332_11215 [Bacteroidota bacterium]
MLFLSTPSQNPRNHLPKDHVVEILESKDGWVKVKTTAVIEGWVSERFVGVMATILTN